jgi:hypothetical protein
MLVFLALLSLASASTLRIHSLDGNQTPLNVVQLLRNSGQATHGTVQYLGQAQAQLGLEPNRQQYSLISVQPALQQQSIQTILPHDQQVILASGQPNIHQQFSFEAVQPNRQQISVVSVQPNNQRLATIETIQPNNQRLATIETIQPINTEKQIILQPIGTNQNQQQTITLLQPNRVVLRNPIQTLQIESAAQPLQYSNIVQPVQTAQPLQYSNIVQTAQPLQYSSIVQRPTFRVGNQIGSGRGAQHVSYFLRGSDLENQVVLNQPQVSAFRQTLEPAQYSSVSVLEPQISTLSVQPSEQFNVQQIVQQLQQQQQQQQQDSQLK